IETQTMMIFGKDRHFAKVLDYHSYGREVLFGYLSLYHPFQSFLQAEAVQLSIASGYGGAVRVPSADGENYQWHLAYNGSYANLIETHTDFQPSYSSAISEAQLVWPGVIWMLQRPITISGHVVDSITQKPLVAEIKLKNVNFQNGEHFFSEPRFGRYHLFLPSGTYTIEFSCENYINKALEVTVNQTSALILDVQLERLNENPNKPVINGPTVGNPGIEYEYTFNATDPDGDTLEYYINWGDGDITGWIGPYASGEKISLNHSWEKKGNYIIFAKVRDIFGEVSESASLNVEIPRNRIININSLFFNLILLIKKFIFFG
ncbi:MAG: PKD domain-containing protein, partial [Candidatus Thermoplasmatota archaeon]|nr:PKD domain-containing protein [Candidatus Thermoplasmatota archaeon]